MAIRNKNGFATIATLAMALAGAWAQDATPPKDQGKDAEPAKEEEAAVKVNWLSFGYSGWRPLDNRHKVRQYALPPSGLVVRDLRLYKEANGTGTFGTLGFRGTIDGDMAGGGVYQFNRGQTIAKVDFSKHEFYDVSPTPMNRSGNSVVHATVEHAITPSIGVFARYRNEKRDEYYEAPKDPLKTRTWSLAGGVQGRLMGGNLGVTMANDRYFDRAGNQPRTITNRIEGRYSVDAGENLTFEGNAGFTKIDQLGLQNSSVKNWGVSANWDIGPRTLFLANTSREDYSLPNVKNAYFGQRFNTTARLIHRWNGWTGQLGFRHREGERYRMDQSFIDVPRFNTWDAKFSGRLSDSVRLSVRAAWEHVNKSTVMQTVDARRLYWDDRVSGSIRLDGGGERFNGYASYSYRFDQNDARQVELTTHNIVLGGSYVFSNKLDGYVEMASELGSARGVIDAGGLSLDNFFPSSTSLAVGFNLAISPKASLSTSLNYYVTNNDNPLLLSQGNVRGTQLTLQYHREFSPTQMLDFVVAPWQWKDRVYEPGSYRSTTLMLTYSVKF